MPFGLLNREYSTAAKVGFAFVLLGVAWIGFQSGFLSAILALGVASPTVLGLVLLAIFAYWAFDELEDDDDASAVISKTADRAETATGGLLNSTAALILGAGTIVATVGMQALDGVGGLLELAMGAPLVAAHIGTIGVSIGGLLGFLSTRVVIAAAVALLALGIIAHRRTMGA